MKCFVYALDLQAHMETFADTQAHTSTQPYTAVHVCLSCALLFFSASSSAVTFVGKANKYAILLYLFFSLTAATATRLALTRLWGRGVRETQTLCNLVGSNLLLILMFKLRTARVIRLIYARRACKYATCKLIKRRGA